MNAAEAYPLYWPLSRPRMHHRDRERSRFKTTFGVARDTLVKEIRLLKAREGSVVLSTNIPLRRDGLPYADARAPEDPGVAVYFTDAKGRQVAIGCDRWDRVADNIHAISLTIGALRGLDRWGTSQMVEAAFSGFAALPDRPVGRPWTVVLGSMPGDHPDVVRLAYARLARERHPDRGGSEEAMQELNAAMDEFRRERGLT